MKRVIPAVAILTIAIGVSSQAGAVFLLRSNVQTAVGHCQAALPSFEGALRKRPLGITNEGQATVFVNCGLATADIGSAGTNRVIVALTNNTATPTNVSCTLISGLGNAREPTSTFPKTETVGPGPAQMFWTSAVEGGGIKFKTSSIQCALPPGLELNATLIDFDENVNL